LFDYSSLLYEALRMTPKFIKLADFRINIDQIRYMHGDEQNQLTIFFETKDSDPTKLVLFGKDAKNFLEHFDNLGITRFVE
jgi:hypothetical protein